MKIEFYNKETGGIVDGDTSDPVRQHQMLKSIGASPIIDPQTSKLIIYDVAIINRMSTPMTNSPFTINMDAFDGS